MPGSGDGGADSPREDEFFNDLSRQQQQPPPAATADEHERSSVPKPKRIACVLCRKRKLKCDGSKPSCGTCRRLQHECSYDEIRRKSGPKRGYVKALEARLAQVETLLKTQDDGTTGASGGGGGAASRDVPPQAELWDAVDLGPGSGMPHRPSMRTPQQQQHHSSFDGGGTAAATAVAAGKYDGGGGAGETYMMAGDMDVGVEDVSAWEVIGLGLDEPLPAEEAIEELNQTYFERFHTTLPMIHQARFQAAMQLAPHVRPPVCLRYAMWCTAASTTERYSAVEEQLYMRARKYVQQDEMKGYGESMLTVAHCQTWVLLATYEFKLMYFPRAWMSAGRACRLAQMMGLHRLDGRGFDVKQCLPPPRDWTEREERRRTFWACFCVDRYSSVGTGWPMAIDEADILTALPAANDAYQRGRPVPSIRLPEALEPSGPQQLASFSAVVVMACLFGRNLTHLHRPSRGDEGDRDDDLDGEFWRRHRAMDAILLNTALALPAHLRLPAGLNDPNVIFTNMSIHTSTICLHQAAIYKADTNRMPSRVAAESKVRCITAAAEIASVMRQISHLDLASMNPFISFCLYVAARVFVQYLKSRPRDAQVKASLQFLLTAMYAIKRLNPLTESFLVQLDVDLEGAELECSAQLRMHIQTLQTGLSSSNNTTNNPTRSDACPIAEFLKLERMQGDGDGRDPASMYAKRPTYGDQGIAVYNHPEGCPPGTTAASYSTMTQEMDTSPDDSANNDQQTPTSSVQSQQNASSRTSNTAFSPQAQQLPHLQQQQDPSSLDPAIPLAATMFNTPEAAAFVTGTGFGIPDFSPSGRDGQHSSGAAFSRDWTGVAATDAAGGAGGSSSGATSLTPGSTSSAHNGILSGFAADWGGGGGGGEVMHQMSDAEWDQVLETFSGWENGFAVEQHQQQQHGYGHGSFQTAG